MGEGQLLWRLKAQPNKISFLLYRIQWFISVEMPVHKVSCVQTPIHKGASLNHSPHVKSLYGRNTVLVGSLLWNAHIHVCTIWGCHNFKHTHCSSWLWGICSFHSWLFFFFFVCPYRPQKCTCDCCNGYLSNFLSFFLDGYSNYLYTVAFYIKLGWILASYWTFILHENNWNFLVFAVLCICGSEKIGHSIMDLEEILLSFIFFHFFY